MIPERYASVTYALFRIVFGYVFFIFGLQKLFGVFGGDQAQLMSLQGAAGVVETVGGFLVMIGLLTKLAAFISSGEMAFAYFINHNPRGFFPIQNGGERAALFCFFFLFLWTAGPGTWSVDRWLRREKRRPATAGHVI